MNARGAIWAHIQIILLSYPLYITNIPLLKLLGVLIKYIGVYLTPTTIGVIVVVCKIEGSSSIVHNSPSLLLPISLYSKNNVLIVMTCQGQLIMMSPSQFSVIQ